MDGFIVIDKPAGLTSHDVVNVIRRLARQKKVGHTGTLDPFATGVLPVALGEATKAIPYLDESIKEYRAVMRLGACTDTQDCTGAVLQDGDWRSVAIEKVNEVFNRFTGRMIQIPPMFSAIKHKGVPLYKIARRGDSIERTPREIEVFSLVVGDVDLPQIAFTVRCSRGTYVRTLAHDIGQALGCGAHLTKLQRTASGPFTLAMANSMERLDSLAAAGEMEELLISPYDALCHLPDLQTGAFGREKLAHGALPDMGELSSYHSSLSPGGRVRISSAGRLLAVAEVVDSEEFRLRLMRVFN